MTLIIISSCKYHNIVTTMIQQPDLSYLRDVMCLPEGTTTPTPTLELGLESGELLETVSGSVVEVWREKNLRLLVGLLLPSLVVILDRVFDIARGMGGVKERAAL